jgi:hypothetical protein
LTKGLRIVQAGSVSTNFFFIPNVGKILVTSYVLLGRDRLEGLMMDFNSLVRNVNGAPGMMRIQVFPVVLVVREGMDKVGI